MFPVDTRAALSHHFSSGRVRGTQVSAEIITLCRTLSVCVLLSSPLSALFLSLLPLALPPPVASFDLVCLLLLSHSSTVEQLINAPARSGSGLLATSINSDVEIEAVDFIAAIRRHSLTGVFEAMPDVYTVHTKSGTAATTEATTATEPSIYCINKVLPSNVTKITFIVVILF